MKKNASYETHRPPVHEEVQLQDKAKPTDVRFKLTNTISRSNDNKTNCSTLNKKETNLKPKCNALVAVISLLVIVMVATVALFAYALVSSNQGMDILMQEIQELKLQLNKTKEESEADFVKLKKEFTQLETEGLNTLSTAIDANMEQFTSLQSSVSSLNTTNGATTTQLNSLESSVRFLNTASRSTTNQLNSLQLSVSSLTTRVNSPVNLYQNCIQETRSCTNTSGSGYLKSCTTSSLTVNKSVSLLLLSAV